MKAGCRFIAMGSMNAAAWLLWLLAAPGWAELAIVGARVYTVAAPEPLENATVLVANGRIEQVGVELPVPFEYRRIDAAGKIVTPAFIESYSHFGLIEIEGEATTNDAALLEYPLGPAFDVSLALNPASTLIAVNRMDGVSRAITAPRPGVDALAGLAASVSLGTGRFLLEPKTALFGHIGAASAELAGGSRAAVMQRLGRALDEAARFSPSRYRPGPGDYSRHDMAALKAYLRSGKPLVLAVDRAAEIQQAINLAEDHDLRLIVLGGAEAWRVRDALAAVQRRGHRAHPRQPAAQLRDLGRSPRQCRPAARGWGGRGLHRRRNPQRAQPAATGGQRRRLRAAVERRPGWPDPAGSASLGHG